LGRDEENLDETMEKAVSNILQTFMIHESVVVGETEQRRRARGVTKDTSTQRDQNGLRLVITKVNFINHNHNQQSIRTRIVPQNLYPKT
jgi:hypothetical protein